MGIFTGKPNPGYLGAATFVNDNAATVVFRVASLEQFDGMNWNDATICNPNGVADYGKGISEGMCRIRAVWDTGYNQEANLPVGAEGTLEMTFGAVGTNAASSWEAKVKSRGPAFTSRGLVSCTVTFLLTGSGTDFAGNTFNDPTV